MIVVNKTKALQNKRNAAVMTASEFKLALFTQGYLDQVEASYPSWSKDIQIMYDNSQTFERMNPTLISMMKQLGFTDAQADTLFGI